MSILDFGPVYVNTGKYKGRIGYFDDANYDPKEGQVLAMVIFGDIFLASTYHIIPLEYLSEINNKVLYERRTSLVRAINAKAGYGKKISQKKRIFYLEEIDYVNNLLRDRMYHAMFKHSGSDIKIFLSHSSLDKSFVMPLAVDLKNYGFDVWLDEWKISAGESIPTKISEGIEESQFLILVLSPNSVSSKWVENEWQAKYWEEIEFKKIKLIPIIIEKCSIPSLLKSKKYIDFTNDYSIAFEDICLSIKKLVK